MYFPAGYNNFHRFCHSSLLPVVVMKTAEEIVDKNFRSNYWLDRLMIKDADAKRSVIEAMEEYAEQFKPDPPTQSKLTWQSSTLQQPEVWTDRSDEEYELMNHLSRFNWRQIEK